jgi:hypothetical protein
MEYLKFISSATKSYRCTYFEQVLIYINVMIKGK